MSLFQEAACLNNEGVVALQRGDCESAITSMGKSIHLLKFELARMRLNRPDCCWNSYSNNTNTNFYSRILQRMKTIEIPSIESADTMIFHKQAVIIPAMDMSLPPSDDSEMNLYTGSVLYNVALTHHWAAATLSGCDCASTRTTKLEQAKKLYMMALQLLDNEPAKLWNVRTALIVKLACINNLSQIQYSMGDYKTAQQGLNHISWFIRHNSLKHRAVFEEPEIQSMLLNVLFLKAPNVASAA